MTRHQQEPQCLPLSRISASEAEETRIVDGLIELLNNPGSYDLIEVNGEFILIRPERSYSKAIASPPAFSPDARARCHDLIMAA